MVTHTVIFKAHVAHHMVRIIHRFFNDRNEYSLSITGGKWDFNTFFAPGLGERIKTMRRELEKDHPRAKWHVSHDDTAAHYTNH